LLVEVSDSSLRLDRRIKAPLYAETEVPEYWIVDVSGDELRIEVHTEPSADGYQRVEVLRDGDVLRPTHLPGVAIAVSDLPWTR
jgi:Uma2 family endonuclease